MPRLMMMSSGGVEKVGMVKFAWMVARQDGMNDVIVDRIDRQGRAARTTMMSYRTTLTAASRTLILHPIPRTPARSFFDQVPKYHFPTPLDGSGLVAA